MKPKINASALLGAIILFGITGSTGWAQITIDWKARKLTGYPRMINGPITTEVTVVNVNDLLYT